LAARAARTVHRAPVLDDENRDVIGLTGAFRDLLNLAQNFGQNHSQCGILAYRLLAIEIAAFIPRSCKGRNFQPRAAEFSGAGQNREIPVIAG